MRRLILPALVGWLLGLVTAAAVPSLLYERQTVPPVDLETRTSNGARVLTMPRDGWLLTSVIDDFYTFERPRLRLP